MIGDHYRTPYGALAGQPLSRPDYEAGTLD